MASDLEHVGATAVVIQGAQSAAADEARHRDLCAVVAESWGARDPKNHVPPRERIGRASMDPRDRVLWEVVAVCCVSETMNAALLTRCLEVAKDPEIRKAVRELLKDEVQHARLGWAHIAAERAQGRGDFLRDVLPLMLEASVEPGFLEGTAAPPPWDDALYAYGELPWEELVGIYCETMESVIFKGLDGLGVDTSKGRAWLAERRRGAQLASSRAPADPRENST